MKKHIKEIIIGVSIIFAVSIYVGAGIYKQKQENKIKGLLLKAKLSCIEKATESYYENWNDNCKRLGMEDGCALPSNSAKFYTDNLSKEKDDCMKLYE